MKKKKTKKKTPNQTRRAKTGFLNRSFCLSKNAVDMLDKIAKRYRNNNRSAAVEEMIRRTYRFGFDATPARDLMQNP